MKAAAFFSAFSAVLLTTVSAHDSPNASGNDTASTFDASSQTLTDPYPYFFPVPDAQKDDDTPFPMPLCYGQRIEEASIVELQAYLVQGTLTSVKLVECYLRRIGQVDTFVECVVSFFLWGLGWAVVRSLCCVREF